jgi:hypothetical protein
MKQHITHITIQTSPLPPSDRTTTEYVEIYQQCMNASLSQTESSNFLMMFCYKFLYLRTFLSRTKNKSLIKSICSHYPFDKIFVLHLGRPKLESSQGPATLTNILFVVLAHPRNLWDSTFKQTITASFPFIIQNHTAKASDIHHQVK